MDFDQYVAARYGRLIEHAVLLGCAEGEAGTYVDQVLLEQRKRIRRAEDPDPLVLEALERAISGTPERPQPDRAARGPRAGGGRRRGRRGADLSAAARADAVAVRARRRAGAGAARGPGATTWCCARRGRASRPGWCVGSDPPSGGPVGKGATVTVRTVGPRPAATASRPGPDAPPPGSSSGSRWAARRPVRRDGATPRLLQLPRTFVGDEVGDRERWGEAFDLIAEAAQPDRAAPAAACRCCGSRRRSRPTSGAGSRGRPRPGCARRCGSRSTRAPDAPAAAR